METIWALIRNDSYVYLTEPNMDGQIAVANETHEKYWENESSGKGNMPELVYDSNYWGVWHCHDHSVLNDSTNHEFNRFPVGTPATTTDVWKWN